MNGGSMDADLSGVEILAGRESSGSATRLHMRCIGWERAQLEGLSATGRWAYSSALEARDLPASEGTFRHSASACALRIVGSSDARRGIEIGGLPAAGTVDLARGVCYV